MWTWISILLRLSAKSAKSKNGVWGLRGLEVGVESWDWRRFVRARKRAGWLLMLSLLLGELEDVDDDVDIKSDEAE